MMPALIFFLKILRLIQILPYKFLIVNYGVKANKNNSKKFIQSNIIRIIFGGILYEKIIPITFQKYFFCCILYNF